MKRSFLILAAMLLAISFGLGTRANAQWNSVTGMEGEVIVHGGNGFGSINTIVRRFSTVDLTIGTAITYNDDSSYGASFLINSPGVYSISYTDQRTDNAFPYFWYYIEVDHAAPHSDISTITATPTIAFTSSSGPYMVGKNSVTMLLDAGDVVRPWWWGNTGGTYADQFAQFVIVKVR